ncbi:MAG: hypothetical protein K6B28_02145 [Lachnospiraceae bacterium]|nr:hypothetical protein [Lachnospiraceae bacterium]
MKNGSHMNKIPTDELNDMLKDIKPEQVDEYLKANRKYLADDEKAFYYYMKDVLDEKNIKLKDVYSFADVSESYGSQIITMQKHTKNRDLIIKLCLAGHFNWEETNRALKLYGMSELYAKDSRDACLIVAINNRVYDIYEIDEMLTQRGFDRLV